MSGVWLIIAYKCWLLNFEKCIMVKETGCEVYRNSALSFELSCRYKIIFEMLLKCTLIPDI